MVAKSRSRRTIQPRQEFRYILSAQQDHSCTQYKRPTESSNSNQSFWRTDAGFINFQHDLFCCQTDQRSFTRHDALERNSHSHGISSWRRARAKSASVLAAWRCCGDINRIYRHIDKPRDRSAVTSPSLARPSFIARICIALIRLYQIVLSPIFGGRCRFHPSCSIYATEAFVRHGAWSGGWLTLRRLARCHPWGGCGEDPVP